MEQLSQAETQHEMENLVAENGAPQLEHTYKLSLTSRQE